MSETIYSQFRKAQVEIKNPKKDSRNPFLDKPYESLLSVLEAVIEPLNKNGLSFSQSIEGGEIITTIYNESGEKIVSKRPFIIPNVIKEVGKGNFILTPETDPQVIGKVETYSRRYGLKLALGLTAEDDDANGVSRPQQTATKPTATATKPAPAPAAAAKPATTAAKPATAPAPATSGKTLDDIKNVEGVVVTETEDGITVSGKTYSLSNDLKALGFIWVGTEKSWRKKVEKAA